MNINIDFTPKPISNLAIKNDISISREAAVEILKQATTLRVSVKGSGCNGYSYVLEKEDKEPTDYDVTFTMYKVRLVVDKKSYVYLKGLTIDYVTEGFKQGFIFDNPNETSSCGCGESFSV